MSSICTYHASGSGGMFITSMLGRMLDIKKVNFIDNEHGDYHQSDDGEWADSSLKDDICFIGDGVDHQHAMDRTVPAKIYYTHNHEFVKKLKTMFNDLRVFAIDADEDDFVHITTLFIKKGFPNLWTKHEYDRWVATGCNFPPYNISNLDHPDVFDIMHEQLNKDTIKWHNNIDRTIIDHTIKFKTVFGLDGSSLEDRLETILNKPVPAIVKQLINQYQQRNKELYFNA